MAVRTEDLEALRLPLTRYCYRLLGSATDVDDAVQETLIRASDHADRYDPDRARLTTWVHRIATHVCLDLLRGARRRALAMDLAPAATGTGTGTGTGTDIGQPLPPDRFVEPMPGRRLFGAGDPAADPAEVVLERETVRLAVVAMLQRLAPRQRAVLVLRDILAFSAREAADILDTTVPAVNSALQRARAVLRDAAPEPSDLVDPTDAGQQDLLRRYVAAFETHDVAGLKAVLRDDAIASMPPFAWWLQSGSRIAEMIASSDACAGARLLPTDVNGQPGFGQYRPDGEGVLRPFAVIAVDVRQGRVAHIATFLGSGDRFAEFGLPDEFSPADR